MKIAIDKLIEYQRDEIKRMVKASFFGIVEIEITEENIIRLLDMGISAFHLYHALQPSYEFAFKDDFSLYEQTIHPITDAFHELEREEEQAMRKRLEEPRRKKERDLRQAEIRVLMQQAERVEAFMATAEGQAEGGQP